jgi:hypothetical protein
MAALLVGACGGNKTDASGAGGSASLAAGGARGGAAMGGTATGGTATDGGSAVGTGGVSASGGAPGAAASGGTQLIPLGGTTGSGGDTGEGGNGDVCATVSANAELEPVFLAFAFDVSGSMGKGDHPWHDATLKWDPVVAATRGFFEDPASAGLTASLTAFPIDASDDERCDPMSYTHPDVDMTALPSTKFGEALDAIRAEDWRGGTPTLAVVTGVLSHIDDYRVDHPGHYVLVLVTDGYPQDCDDDSIESVENAVHAVASDIPTYVIGVKNPPLTDDDGNMAPDTVSNLVGVAEAGGTDTAFIIDTGDPAKTTAALQAAVDQIRGVAISCSLDVPKPPGGRTFEKDHVVVSYASGSTQTELVYDADCTGDRGWHYDDLDKPSQVVLCPATCTTVQADAKASLAVGFTCEPVLKLPR